jgi:transcriptional regulator with XRE-family HTH domain
VISAPVVEHLRTALFGATLVAVEDVATLAEDLSRGAAKPQPGKRAAYHGLMAALRLRYELQQAVGLPGEPPAEVELYGLGPDKAVLIEALTDYRDAAVALLDEGHLTQKQAEQAAERIELLNGFLGGSRADGAAQRREQRLISATLAEVVDTLSAKHGLTQEQLAGRSGVSTYKLRKLKKEHADPALSTVLGLCRGLNVSVTTLLGGLPLPGASPAPRAERRRIGRAKSTSARGPSRQQARTGAKRAAN